MSDGFVAEVFPSFQGEGLFVGQRQLFIRFAGCNRRCAYCDSRDAWKAPARATLYTLGGKRVLCSLANPLCVGALLSAVDVVEGSVPRRHSCRWHGRLAHDSSRAGRPCHDETPACEDLVVSLTGGEPLLQATFLRLLLPLLRARRMRTYLETNGTLPAQIRRVAQMVDVAAIDIKLPSATRQPLSWATVSSFARAAAPVPRKFYKLVVTAAVKDSEVEQVGRFLEATHDIEAVIVQPASPVRRGVRPPSIERLEIVRAMLARSAQDVRVVPQVHRMAGWR